jgi:hypothetical protein|tara:strand:+ start:2406 stop:4661 length:2256 start_codon:yes stop_codon:yes gene_type:complete
MIDTSLIPKPENTTKTVKRLGDTQDIIDSIIRVDQKYKSKQFEKFAKQFDTKDGLKRLWNFVKYEIKYKVDDFERSLQLTPPALWKKKSGDCKSKTIFVNAVLRSLQIPYIIRFTNYTNKHQDVKHVYTVAIIDNKEIPIDTVYSVFGKEKKYVNKKDYPMAEIVEISGLSNTPITKTYKIPSKEVKYLYSNDTPATKLRQEEVRQKQQYVQQQAPIQFNKISESQATLKVAREELQLIQVMVPRKSKLATKGIELINKALQGNFTPTGVIPEELSGTIHKIKMAEKQGNRSAMSFGINQETKNILLKRRKEDERLSQISGFPSRVCLERSLWLPRKMDQQAMRDNPSLDGIQWLQDDFYPVESMYDSVAGSNWAGTCTGYDLGNGDWQQATVSNAPGMFLPGTTPNQPNKFGNIGGTSFYSAAANRMSTYYGQGTIPGGTFFKRPFDAPYLQTLTPAQQTQWLIDNRISIRWGDVNFFNYGHASKYKKSFFEMEQSFNQAVQLCVDKGYLSGGGEYGWYSFWAGSQTNFDLAVEILNDSSGILSDQINDVYRSDSSLNGSGSMGSGLLYTFLNSTNRNIADFPVQVQQKMGFQNQFLDACNYFSGVSRSNVKGMSRNGVLYNTGGEQPETILQDCLGLSEGTLVPPGVGCAGICATATIISAIAIALTTITATIVDSVNRSKAMELEAKKIDALASNQANFPPPGGSFMPGNGDWPPPPPPPGSEEEDNKKKMLMIGAGMLGAVALLGSK